MTEYKSFLKTVGGNEGGKCNYPTRLDTYGRGCAHNCKYCYARSLLEFRGLWNPMKPAVADIEKIRKRVGKIKPGTILRLGGMTDCFQPVEKIHRVTLETIKALNERGIGYLIVTKSAMVADDEYMAIYDKRLAHIQMTITATDDNRARQYENASKTSDRIRAAEKLQEAGFDIALCLSPFIPEYVDVDVLSTIKVDKLLVEFLRCNASIRKIFPIDYSEYTVKQSGYWHLPLAAKIRYVSRIYGFREISVCDDESEAYEWWRTNFNPNPGDCCNLSR